MEQDISSGLGGRERAASEFEAKVQMTAKLSFETTQQQNAAY
jgi:hypothetical protein